MDLPIVIMEAKGRTSSVRICDGKVVMRLPAFLRGRQREEVIEKFRGWASKRLSEVEVGDFVLPEYKDGGRIVTHNKVYDLEILERRGSRSSVYLEGGVLKIALGPKGDLKDLVEKKIMEDQLPYLKEVLGELNALYFQADYNEVRFRRVKSRFGSCSSTRNITIAYRLLFAPRDVFRYVCVHELAHLIEFNHSSRFWALVAEAMPGYKDQERWLKSNGMLLG